MTTLISKIADYSHSDLIRFFISIINIKLLVTFKGTSLLKLLHYIGFFKPSNYANNQSLEPRMQHNASLKCSPIYRYGSTSKVHTRVVGCNFFEFVFQSFTNERNENDANKSSK